MNRGDIYTCRFDPIEGSEQGGVRPAVIVSRTAINAVRRTVVVIPITSNLERQANFHAFLAKGDGGLAYDSVALGDQIRTVAKTRLGRRWGTVSADTMAKIDTILKITLALDLN